MIYDRAYLNKYIGYDKTPTSKALAALRADMTCAVAGIGNPVVDWGCCTGIFLEHMKDLASSRFGVEINDHAVEYCLGRNLDVRTPEDMAKSTFWRGLGNLVMTFWDSFEHMRDPGAVLNLYKPKYVLISAPCLDGFLEAADKAGWDKSAADDPHASWGERRARLIAEYLPLWKHYRPEEHLWNFTQDCLCLYLEQRGYEVKDVNFDESKIRRDAFLGDKNIMTVGAIRK